MRHSSIEVTQLAPQHMSVLEARCQMEQGHRRSPQGAVRKGQGCIRQRGSACLG